MDQRIGMDHLCRTGKGQSLDRVPATHAADLQSQNGPHPLTARQKAVLHGVIQTGHGLARPKTLLEAGLDQGDIFI